MLRGSTQTKNLDLSLTIEWGSLPLLHQWLLQKFKADTPYGDFQLAAVMDVHRAIGDWLVIRLIEHNLARPYMFCNSDQEAHGFVLNPMKYSGSVMIKWGDLQTYNPWVDRHYDDVWAAFRYADLYVDKYYDVMVNEFYIVHRKLRKRPDGSIFEPLSVGEHPRYASKTAKSKAITIPPFEWKALIEGACTAAI